MPWRFSSVDQPAQIEGFDRRSRHTIAVDADNPAPAVARHFGMDGSLLVEALEALAAAGSPPVA